MRNNEKPPIPWHWLALAILLAAALMWAIDATRRLEVMIERVEQYESEAAANYWRQAELNIMQLSGEPTRLM